MAVSQERRQRIADAVGNFVLSSQMRDDSLEALERLVDNEHGTAVIRVPRSKSKPIDVAVIQGGLVARFVETREIV